MTIHRAADRFVTEQPGISTRHAFSAGAHYHPDNLSFGPVIGCDEHEVGPGAGFDWHAHRGVVIVSWVLDGTLRHEDDGGGELVIAPGEVLVQSCGKGIRHRETNASDTSAVRFVQTTLLADLDRSVWRPGLPERIGAVTLDVVPASTTLGPGYAVIGSGRLELDGVELGAGDALRLDSATAPTGGDTRVLHVLFDA